MRVPITSGNRSGSCSENCGFRIAQVVGCHSENGISNSGNGISNLSGPVLRDTARLSQRYPPIARYGLFGVSTWPIGCDTPSPFSESFPCGGHAKWRCDTPPPQKGYLSYTGAIPYENKANECDTPLCDTISKGYCAIGGGISHWAAKFQIPFPELLREYPGTLRGLREWPFRSESVFPEIGVVSSLLRCFQNGKFSESWSAIARSPTEPRNPETSNVHSKVRKMPFWTPRKNGPELECPKSPFWEMSKKLAFGAIFPGVQN